MVVAVPAVARPRRVAVSTLLAGHRFYAGAALCALTLAALSLLLPSTPSYDPWAWLIWGREIVHLNLHTTAGPSWKPLPVMFTAVFAPSGAAQPDLWLVVARAGALMALAMVFRLAHRMTRDLVGPGLLPPLLAGLIAAASLANSGGFVTENALGYSEGLAVALALIAVDRALDGAPRQALVAGFLAGLDRPELWVVWVPFGVWVWAREPGSRRLVAALFLLTPALWFLPELWGSGHLFRGVVRAHHPNPGTPAYTHCPVCTVLSREAWPTLMRRVKFPALLALAAAAWGLWRGRDRWRGGPVAPAAFRARLWLLALGAAGLIWWLGIAVETQAGFAGNPRYLELGTALVAIAGGVAWGWIAALAGRAARRVTGPVAAGAAGAGLAVAVLVATPPWIGRNVINLAAARHALTYQADLRTDLAAALARAGGAGSLRRCGTVMTEGYQVPMVAWMLGLPPSRVKPPPPRLAGGPWPGVILQARAHSGSALLPAPVQIRAWEHAGAHYRRLDRVGTFSVFSTCTHRVRG